MGVDIRQALVHLLGIPVQMIRDELLLELETALRKKKEALNLSPGARLLQGELIVKGPLAGRTYACRRVRQLCILMTALEDVAKQRFGGLPKPKYKPKKKGPSHERKDPSPTVAPEGTTPDHRPVGEDRSGQDHVGQTPPHSGAEPTEPHASAE